MNDIPEDSRHSAEPRPLRVAWIGAEPAAGGGVAGVGWLLLSGLAREGCQIDLFVNGPQPALARALTAVPGVQLIETDTGWRYDRWYSNNRLTKLATGFGNNTLARYVVARKVCRRNAARRYDVIFQFSTIESFGAIRTHAETLPPIVVMPETHAAGELRWVVQERGLSAQCEPSYMRAAAELLLRFRARRQARDIRLARRVVGISEHFAAHLRDDYRLDPAAIRHLPNPVDLTMFTPHPRTSTQKPYRLLFVGRISARKGVDLLVELSHRLSDLEGEVTLEVVGDSTLWSDYRPLLERLNPRIAHFSGSQPHADLVAGLSGYDLFIHPAKFEPFGLTVAEALAAGVPVVAADSVGSVEDVSEACCFRFPSGDVEGLEAAVRTALARLEHGERDAMAISARQEAERLFSTQVIIPRALELLREAAGMSAAREGHV